MRTTRRSAATGELCCCPPPWHWPFRCGRKKIDLLKGNAAAIIAGGIGGHAGAWQRLALALALDLTREQYATLPAQSCDYRHQHGCGRSELAALLFRPVVRSSLLPASLRALLAETVLCQDVPITTPSPRAWASELRPMPGTSKALQMGEVEGCHERRSIAVAGYCWLFQ